MYGRGAVLALVLVLGVLVLPVLWFEVLGFQSARRLSLAVGRGDALATRFWLLIVDPNDMAYPPLVQATQRGNREMIHLLLDAGADVNVRAKVGPTPLEVAASRGDVELMRELLAAGARIVPGYSLNAACRACQAEAVKLLLDAGALPQGEENQRRWLKAARTQAEAMGCDAVLRLLPPESPAPSP